MLQRKATRPGVGLGVSTGWILRSSLAKRDVKIIAGVTYRADRRQPGCMFWSTARRA